MISLFSDAHTGYCKQFWSEQSDKCRYSCIKNPSQWGCVSTRPLFLSESALSGSSNDCCVQHLSQVHFKHLKSKIVSSQTLHQNASLHIERKRCPVVTSQHGVGLSWASLWELLCCCMSLAQPMLYVICMYCMKMYSMLCWYRHLLCYTAMFAEPDLFWLLGFAALRRRRARLWRWAAAASWSGSSWSDGEWPSPGPRRTPWGPTEAWLAPAWRSHCWNAAIKYDQSVCKHGKTDLSHIFFETRHNWYDVIHWDRFIFVVFSHESTIALMIAQARLKYVHGPWTLPSSIPNGWWSLTTEYSTIITSRLNCCRTHWPQPAEKTVSPHQGMESDQLSHYCLVSVWHTLVPVRGHNKVSYTYERFRGTH